MIVFITGISGAGKNTALRILEDNGYYCIDNVPIDIIPKIIDIAQNSNIQNIAFIIDPRIIIVSEKNIENLKTSINQLIDKTLDLVKKYSIKLIFLDCNEKTILKRYNSSRRIHPIKPDNIEEGIKIEKELLKELKNNSDYLIDTSNLSPYDLAAKILEFLLLKKISIIKLISFGYKYGFVNTDFVIDVRLLSNPFYVKELSDKTGLDKEVKEYILKDSFAREFIEKTLSYIEYLIKYYFTNVKNFLEIGVGCTGGKHRSVMVVEYIAEKLRPKYENIQIQVEHRDIYK